MSSIAFDLVNLDRIKRDNIVEAITTTIRPEAELTMLQITTSASSRRIIKSNSIALAVC